MGGGQGSVSFANIEALDQAIFEPENMHDHLIKQQLAFEVVYDLVDVRDHFLLRADGEADRLDVRIDHRPLTGPVAAHAFATVDVPSFHSVGPGDVVAHGCKHRVHVAGVETGVDALE